MDGLWLNIGIRGLSRDCSAGRIHRDHADSGKGSGKAGGAFTLQLCRRFAVGSGLLGLESIDRKPLRSQCFQHSRARSHSEPQICGGKQLSPS